MRTRLQDKIIKETIYIAEDGTGHSSIAVTFEYYAEVMDENDKIISFINNEFCMEGDEENARS